MFKLRWPVGRPLLPETDFAIGAARGEAPLIWAESHSVHGALMLQRRTSRLHARGVPHANLAIGTGGPKDAAIAAVSHRPDRCLMQ